MSVDTPDIKTLSVDGVDYVIALPNWKTDYIQGKISSSGEPYEHSMLRSMSSRLKAGDLVLDVGANIGNHTLYLAAVTGCRVHSFEPNKMLCGALQQSIEANGLSDTVWVHNVGVGSATGSARFAHEDEANLGAQSLLVEDGDSAGIEVIRLDDLELDGPVAALKIDVEGMEQDVLEGAKKLLTRDKPLLYIECQKKEDFHLIAQWVGSQGYIYNETYNATPTHLFIHKSKIGTNDQPELTLVKLREALYERDAELQDTKERLNQSNLKYREVNRNHGEIRQRVEDLRKELFESVERESRLNQENKLLQDKLLVAQQSLTYVLRKHLSRVKRSAKTPGGLRNLVLRLGVRLVRSPVYIRALLKHRLSDESRLAVNPSIVPPRNLNALKTDTLQTKSSKELRVACIMDDFTWSSYAPECQLNQLTPANWRVELEECQPELLFVESAWRGKDQLWGSKVGHTSQELQEILRWCRERNVPTVFWNKEDPVHFETFLNTARLFDFVFTTDIDCVPRYKAVLGHNEVYFLPFACQPREHNPFEKYVRKDAFCFAGAYYARYPERARDLEGFVGTLPEYRPLEIYDRNYGKDDPDYAFPEAFRPHIVGTLPFSEIDKAYKGYRYAINLNSIKQSQTMFARRVYELLASNTLTVSNFSRGLRLMFGDLVLSSDSGKQLVSELESMEAGDKVDRVRLAALRKVLSEHTYEDRLNYALARITRTERKVQLPTFRMIGVANSKHDAITLLEQWKRQQGADVSLTIVHDSELTDELAVLKTAEGQRVTWLPYEQLQGKSLADLAEGSQWIAGASNRDYYGPNYFRDIALTTRYRVAQAIGKWASYHWSDGICELVHAGTEYRPADILFARSSAIQITAAGEIKASEWLDGLESWRYELQDQFSIDRFNYCADMPEGQAAAEIRSQVDDLDLDHGLPLEELNRAAESALPKKDVENGSHALSGALLGRMITRKGSYADHLDQHTVSDTSTVIRVSKNPAIEAELDGLYLNIVSRLNDGQHEYIYCPESISIERLAIDIGAIRNQGLPIHLEMDPGLNLSLVVLFFDGAGEKIKHYIEPANRNAVVNVPENASALRLGLRVYAGGTTTVRRLIFGYKSLEPGHIFGKSDVLLLTNHYPSYDDLYRNGFVHTRVKAYAERGVGVDVFRLRQGQEINYHEFQGVDVMSGSETSLRQVLSSGKYRHILVHFLDKEMWSILKTQIERIKVTVWIHGAEIQPWWRREYNYADEFALEQAKKESTDRLEFWRSIFADPPENLNFVFVSNYFANEVMEDVGVVLSSKCYEVIHNPVDTELFNYVPKSQEQRKKILSIRPYASPKYANDLSVKAVLELSRESFFPDLEFLFVGDGVLFDTVLEPLRQYANVEIRRGFLSQHEIAQLHKEYGIFLCPTRMDAQGVSKDEAMSSGLAVVTNRVTAIPEFIDEGCGLLAEDGDYKGMAKAISDVYRSETEFLKLSAAAAHRARSQVGKKLIIDQELALFKALGGSDSFWAAESNEKR
ncbi:FkbM family methyltransferase [Marinobacter sp. NP-4(2019)]|uniref:FkbM family methyltransferase n=1 Tax=Marinobacter sp. NP-4(2019) TaxID=2488665 RepID=UPI000FC3DFAB|nr:FkbM family methyltransferase [Marinobacter sp. NP-4(2019)]AZT84508.1 FkbM family methyltransferase [Marinobacter sp. NP-4(2019)]